MFSVLKDFRNYKSWDRALGKGKYDIKIVQKVHSFMIIIMKCPKTIPFLTVPSYINKKAETILVLTTTWKQNCWLFNYYIVKIFNIHENQQWLLSKIKWKGLQDKTIFSSDVQKYIKALGSLTNKMSFNNNYIIGT